MSTFSDRYSSSSRFLAGLLLALCLLPVRTATASGVTECSGPTGASMNLVVLADSLVGMSEGQSVRALAEGTCVGEAIFTGGNLAVPIWGSDPIDDNGLNEGDPVSLIVAETGIPLTGLFEDYMGGDLMYLSYMPDAVYLSHRLTVFASEVGFASAGVSVGQGGQAEATIRLQHTGTVPLAGFQFDLMASGVNLDAVSAGGAVSGGSWSFSAAPIDGGVRVLAVNPSGGLSEGSHTIVNLDLSTTEGGTVQITDAVGTLADEVGTDADLGISQSTFTVSVDPRGDVNENGTVDIADFVAAIDIVLEVSTFNDAADVYPFPEGDDLVDVRDLNVLGRAILATEWPDGSPIMTGGNRSKDSADVKRGGGVVYLHPLPGGGGYRLGTDTDLRAIQGVAETTGEMTALGGATIVTHVEEPFTHFMVYTLSTDPLPELFAAGPDDLSPETLTELVGVTPDGETVPLTASMATAGEGGLDEAVALEVYPNPARDAVRFTRAVSGTVYDVLGRRVAEFEDATRLELHSLRAGAYYVRAEEQTFPLTILK
jgi:hypothetical protein